MEEVRNFFRRMSNSRILEYTLGVEHPSAPALAASTIVVVMDCEKYESHPRVLTEYGLHTFTRSEMVPVLRKSTGFHGENLLKNIYYYHMRILGTAHFINHRFCPGNPENNHFGSTRFATKLEATEFLTRCIAWPLDPDQPNGAKCPVVFLGHAVKNELEMLQQDLDIDPSAMSNVVAVIDTQNIANEQGYRGRGDRIGLEVLTKQCSMQFRDAHTAGNDAAYTIIAAVQMVMKNRLPRPGHGRRSLQDVVDDLEKYSSSIDPGLGIAKYCTRCARQDHTRKNCKGYIKRCEKCLEIGAEKAAYTHVTNLCTRFFN